MNHNRGKVNVLRYRKILKLTSDTNIKDETGGFLIVKGQTRLASLKITERSSQEHNSDSDSDMKNSNQEKRSPKSEPKTNNKVLNLPLLHESQKTPRDDGETSELGSIKRPHDGVDSLNPLVIQAFNRMASENDTESISSESTNTSTSSVSETETLSQETIDFGNVEKGQISSFPPVDDDEINKHRHLNEEAEKNKSKPLPNRDQSYLKRLQLERKQVPGEKPKDLKFKKKILKRMQTKPKIHKEVNDDFVEMLPSPPKPREVDAKSIKLILGFRYSYAIEQYYRSKMKQCGSRLKIKTSSVNQDTEEILNGWVVKSLGPSVLNLQARTMPSCNPIELRMRRQQTRMRNLGRSRGRTWSNDSRQSFMTLQSHDPLTKLNPIEEDRKSGNSERKAKSSTDQELDGHQERQSKERKISVSQGVEVLTIDKSNDSELVLPPIRSPEKFTEVAHRAKKAISLKLPPITSNDDGDNFLPVG